MPHRRGVTAIELLYFLALVAMLSAIGMVALARYVRHSKTAEANESVLRLGTNAAAFYNHSDAQQPIGADAKSQRAMRHFPPSSRVPVPEEATSVRGQKFQSNAADWAISPWKELEFSMVQPQCYQYSFEAQGIGAGARASVVAEGDLNGDGTRSRFELAIAPDAQLEAKVGKSINETLPEQ